MGIEEQFTNNTNDDSVQGLIHKEKGKKSMMDDLQNGPADEPAEEQAAPVAEPAPEEEAAPEAAAE